jgi:hypothetical protein
VVPTFRFALWSRLRTIGNSSAVKMTVLIPLIGYFIVFNENVLQYLELSRSIFGRSEHIQGMEAAAHVSWRLLFTYFALCFLAIGSTIYQFACPGNIKQFGTPTDYIAATRPHMGDVMLGRMESLLKADPLSSQEFDQLQSLAHDRAEAARRASTTPRSREDIFVPVSQGEPPATEFMIDIGVISWIWISGPMICDARGRA